MKFFFVVKSSIANLNAKQLFQQACAQRNIEFVEATPKTFNYLTVSVQPNDLVYRSSGTDACRAIEYFLLRNNAISYYTTLLRGMSTLNDSFFINAMVGLPIIPTIPDISNKQTLTEYVAYLGGFPIIVKATGSSHGVGVMKAESIAGLRSLLDYVSATQTKTILRKFIPHTSQGRLVVVGDKVVASDRATMSITHDFRSNIGDDTTRIWEAHTYTKEIENLAVQAVNACGVEFGGVDILFETSTGNPYISEVNAPCDFAGTQKKTGKDIAGILIDHLIQKVTKAQ